MSTKLRTISELRAAACSRSLRDRAKAFFSAAEKIHALHARLKYPSERLGVVLEHYGVRQLNELPDDVRGLAEEVAAGDGGAAVRFGEYVLLAQLDRLGADGLVSEFSAAFRDELAKEIEAVVAYLKPAYVATDTEAELTVGETNRFGEVIGNAAPPLRVLRQLLERATPCAPGMGVHAIASTFRGIL